MEIVITKKASYFIIFMLILGIFVISTNAGIINVNKAFQSLDQIINSTGDRVDFDNNSIIDYSDEARSTKWDNIIHEGHKCPKHEYLVGFKGNAPICRRLRIICSDGSPECKLVFYTDPDYDKDLVGKLRYDFNGSFFDDFNESDTNETDENETEEQPKIKAIYLAKEKDNVFWASLANNEVVRFKRINGKSFVDYRQQINNPFAITFDDGLVKIGATDGWIYTLNPETGSCSKVDFGSAVNALTQDPDLGLIAADNGRIGVVGGSTIVNSEIDGFAMDVKNYAGKKTLFASYGNFIKVFTLTGTTPTLEAAVNVSELLGEDAEGDEDLQSLYYASGNLFMIIDGGGAGLYDVSEEYYEQIYDEDTIEETNDLMSVSGLDSKVHILEYAESDGDGIVHVHSSSTGNKLSDIELPEIDNNKTLYTSCS